MIDGAVIASFVGGTFVLIVSVGATYRSLRDLIDSTRNDLSGKIGLQTEGINKNAENIASIKGSMVSAEQIREACMSRFKAIEGVVESQGNEVAALKRCVTEPEKRSRRK